MKPTHFSILLLVLSAVYSGTFYAQDWTISRFDRKHDADERAQLYTIDPAHSAYISSLLPVTGIHIPTKTLVLRNREHSMEGYAACVLLREIGLIEIVVINDYAKCHDLLTQTIESLQSRGASEARILFNGQDDPELKQKYGYEAFRMLGFVSESYSGDTQRVVLRKKL